MPHPSSRAATAPRPEDPTGAPLRPLLAADAARCPAGPVVLIGVLIGVLSACKAAPPPSPAAPTPEATAAAAASAAATQQAAILAAGPPPPTAPRRLPTAPTGSTSASGPPLAGDPSGLDVERLARSRTTFQLSTDAPMLGGLASVDPRVLQASFEADPRWRLSLDQTGSGAAIACLRAGTAGDWTARPDGYLEERAAPTTPVTTLFRACVRFSARPADHPWTTSPMVSHNGPEQRDLTVTAVKLQQPELAGWQSAALTIDAPTLTVELHELSPTLDMHSSARVLSDLQQRIASVSMALSRPNPQRAALATLPPGEPALGAPTLRCFAPAEGRVRVRARLNPGSPGWVWARLISHENSPAQAIDEERWARATAERMGASAEPGTTWSFDAQLEAGPLPAKAAVELWFEPDGGGELRMLTPPGGLPCAPDPAG
jgi:hypothetical protein